MYPGCYRYITGTNIEVGVRKLSVNVRTRFKQNNVVWAITRRGKIYHPFRSKKKDNEILPSHYTMLIRQDMPVEILQEKSDFTKKGTPSYRLKSHIKTIEYIDQKPIQFIDNELQWTTDDFDDPCYEKESYKTMKDGTPITMYRYNKKPTSFYTSLILLV